jgi:hypothetical protein
VVVFGSSTWGFADVALLSGLSRSFTGVQIFLATCVDESAAPVFIRDATSGTSRTETSTAVDATD